MSNRITFGSKLSYDQWRTLSGGNVRGYKKYVRQYKIKIELFYKQYFVKQVEQVSDTQNHINNYAVDDYSVIYETKK